MADWDKLWRNDWIQSPDDDKKPGKDKSGESKAKPFEEKSPEKKPPEATVESVTIDTSQEIKEDNPFFCCGKLKVLDGASLTDYLLDVQVYYRYKDKQEKRDQAIEVHVDKQTLEFKFTIKKLFIPNAYCLDKGKSADAKFRILVKVSGPQLDKDGFSAEVEVPMAVKPAPANDYAFIMGRNDPQHFYLNARKFMTRRPYTHAISSTSSLEGIIDTLCSDETIRKPVSNVLIVSHARGEGELFFKLKIADLDDKKIYLDELFFFANDTIRRQLVEDVFENENSTHVHIRGCNIGKEPRYLRLIKQVFGGKVTVSAPKHFDYFGSFPETDTLDLKLEYMKYDFTIYSKDLVIDKNQLIQLFANSHFHDIFNKPISNENWNAWIPASLITADFKANFECTNKIGARLGNQINREYRYTNHEKLFTFTLDCTNGNPPDNRSDRMAELKKLLQNMPDMQDGYPSATLKYPRYMRFGFQSLDDLIDKLEWDIKWSDSSRLLVFTGKRHEYQLRIPITDATGDLMMNVIPEKGDRQYRQNDIVETDIRLFACE